MPAVYTRNMPDSATYWSSVGEVNDGFGGTTKAAPVLIVCRWQDKAVQYRTPSGEQRVSDSIVYCGAVVEVGGFLMQGNHVANAQPPDGAKIIQQRQVSPSLDNTKALYKAML